MAADTEAAGLSVKQVSEILVKATPGHPPDFSHQDLGYLDLSDLALLALLESPNLMRMCQILCAPPHASSV